MRKIREEDGLAAGWYETAKTVKTLDDLSGFMREVVSGYSHDYGTICQALAASGLAALWCADRMGGGITGFQSGAVFWELAREWLGLRGPARLLKFEDMLYPQYDYLFDRTLTTETFEWLKSEAKKKIESDDGRSHPEVLAHWKRIAAGEPPFGYRVVP